MPTTEELGKEIEKIKERNRKVEADKAWEVSLIRRVAISVSTYLLVVIFLTVLGIDKPFLSAIIPAAAYLISTLSLGILKSWWLNKKVTS
ncbi:hypothetical protein HY045_01565 [Candidatus Woesebacteria bacterium]|nr:hypothetical protein [Candidatus Woesebacteria bacterium]